MWINVSETSIYNINTVREINPTVQKKLLVFFFTLFFWKIKIKEKMKKIFWRKLLFLTGFTGHFVNNYKAISFKSVKQSWIFWMILSLWQNLFSDCPFITSCNLVGNFQISCIFCKHHISAVLLVDHSIIADFSKFNYIFNKHFS